MLLWIAILLLADAGFALWMERRLETALPRLNVKLVALIEGGIGILLASIYFWRAN